MVTPKRVTHRRIFQNMKKEAEKLKAYGENLAKSGKEFEVERVSNKSGKFDIKMETYYYNFEGRAVACRYMIDNTTGKKEKAYLCFGPNGRFCRIEKGVNYDPMAQKAYSVYRFQVLGEKSIQSKIISREDLHDLTMGQINWVRCAEACERRVSSAELSNKIFL